MDGEPMHIQCKEDTPIQVDPSVEVMDKLQGFSFHEEMLADANQPRGTNLKQRLLRVESRNSNENNAPSLQTRGQQHAPHIQIWTSSIVRLGWGWGWQWPALFVMAGSLLLLVGVWKSLNHTT